MLIWNRKKPRNYNEKSDQIADTPKKNKNYMFHRSYGLVYLIYNFNTTSKVVSLWFKFDSGDFRNQRHAMELL